MKKFTLSMAALMALGTAAVAQSYDAYGSNSYENSQAPRAVENYMEPAPYFGIAYTYVSGSLDVHVLGKGSLGADVDATQAVTINAGYDFNQYIAAEVRYMSTINDTSLEAYGEKIYTNEKIKNFGAYLKPQLKNGSGTVYGLLGYGKVEFADMDENQFQWGVGFSYDFENSVSLFFDFMRIYDEAGTGIINSDVVSADFTVDTYNFGLSYRF